jgi:hypothetical protein
MEFDTDNNEIQDVAAILELLASDLEPFYEPRLPYHNWDEHIQNGIIAVRNICEQEIADGKPINTLMAMISYMGHDAGYSHDIADPDVWLPYGSKEAYSAHITGELLNSYGFSEDFINGVKFCIMFTKMDATLPADLDEELANTAKVVRTADLFNIFGSYKGFVINSFKLMEEDKIYGREKNLREFKDVTKFVLNDFLEIGFTPAGSCKTIDGLKNIDRFVKDTPSKLLRAVGSQATRFAGLLRKDAA